MVSDVCIICHVPLPEPGVWCLRCQKLEWSVAEQELADANEEEEDDDAEDSNE